MTACLQANFNWLISLNVYHCEFFSSKKKKQNKDKNAEWYFSYNSQLVCDNLDQIFQTHTIFNLKLA